MVHIGWRDDAKGLYFSDRPPEERTWGKVYALVAHYFSGVDERKWKERVRGAIRTDSRYKTKQQSGTTDRSFTMREDGTAVSTATLEIRGEQDMTPEFLLSAHGLDAAKWQVVTYTNNYWDSQVKGGSVIQLFQSKLTVKPFKGGVPTEVLDAYFENKQFRYDKPLTVPYQYDPKGEILEICLPDLHSGLLAWRKETGSDYDVHIAKDHFFKCIYDIKARCMGRKFKKILFVTLGDLLHFDNDEQKTTKGTFQQADGRLTKIYDTTLDMLIDGLTLLAEIAPVEVVYLCGNHDRITGYTLLKATEKAFRRDDNVIFDTEPNPQKHRLMGRVLVGWTHGDMPNKNMGGWLQTSARREYGLSDFAEVHAGHFHSQKVRETKALDYNQTEEDKGVVIRYLPTICNASYWEHQQGYANSVKAVMCFIWNGDTGLREMWYSNI